MADTTHGDFAAEAAAHLARSADPIEGFGGNPQEIDRQSTCLVEWARNKNAILTEAHFSGLEKYQGTTAEHEVFYRASDNRAVKRTYPGTFGVTPLPKGQQSHATPLFYFRRLDLMNRIFGSGLRFEGIALGKSFLLWQEGEHPSLVVSQPWIRPKDPAAPHPSMLEIGEFMQSLGFRSLNDAFFGWRREEDGVTVIDARLDNFIKSSEGVVPIDLVVTVAS
jgi:hypothetical protein